MSTPARSGPSGDARGCPRAVRRTVLLALAGLAAAVPSSSPDGTGMQWDELVLACVAAATAWTVVRRTRTMTRAAALPWRVIAVASSLFTVAQLLAGAFPGPAFDGFGVDDVLLLAGATAPLVTAGLLARRVRGTRWPALVVDGLMVTTALFVLTEAVRTPVVNPVAVGAPDDLRSLVLAYGGYSAVMLGSGAALCTVSTAALRRSATTLVGAIALQALAATCEAMAIVAPSPLWTAGSDLGVALSLQLTALAALRAPSRYRERGARASAPVVSPVGLALLVVAVLSVPLSVGLALLEGESLSTAAELGIAGVFALLGVRLVVRIQEDGRRTQDLVRSEEDFRELVEASSDGVAIVDGELRLQFTSLAARAMLGLPDGVDDVALPDLVEDRASLLQGPAAGRELHFRVGDRELEATSSVRPGRHVLFLRDATSRRRRERELERMAYTDHLTGLPNRAHLFAAMDVPDAGERGLLVLDLDGFKAVNDVAGHEAGDQLLVEMARRLSTLVREDDLVARLGGDEFAVVVAGALDESIEVARRVVDALSLPHRTGDRSFAVGASVGVAPLGAAGGQLAFREADDALREAKRAGKGCVRVFRPEEVGADDLDLATALAGEQFEMRFGTTLDVAGRISFVQTTPVWVHPVRGVVPPQELWAAAERQGLLATMQLEGLQRSCAAVTAMDGVDLLLALPTGQVSGAALGYAVGEVLRSTGLAPSRLVLVVTEETLLTGTADLLPALEGVRGTGVRIFLDDYGMGHSLFALLARVPLDGVRVDLGGLAARDDTDRALQVLAAIVRTTSSFDLTTIADGVDTAELRDQALAAGVQHVTGRVAPDDLTGAEVAALLTAPARQR